ncbi:hypothetical protein BWI97_26645, partial [Siphonobacter sp. BAB-5405]
MIVNKKCVLLFFGFFFFLETSWGQGPYVLTGKVTDAKTGEGIPFATIGLQGKPQGTQADFEGNYRLVTKELADSLLIMSIGYRTKSMPITRNLNKPSTV